MKNCFRKCNHQTRYFWFVIQCNSSLSTFVENDIAERFSKKDDRLTIITLFEKLKNMIDFSCLTSEQKAFVELHLIVDIEEAKNIEVNTVKQSESTLWYQERCKP